MDYRNLNEEGLSQPGKTTTDIDLRTGEVELNLPSGIFTGSLQVTTPTATNAVRRTHFWVSYDKNKNLSTVGVYEGKVEVKTKDGKISTVIPNGDKPGVVVVAQKLSITKLALAGVVLVALAIGLVLIIRRKMKKQRFQRR